MGFQKKKKEDLDQNRRTIPQFMISVSTATEVKKELILTTRFSIITKKKAEKSLQNTLDELN